MSYYTWFEPAVDKWIDLAKFKVSSVFFFCGKFHVRLHSIIVFYFNKTLSGTAKNKERNGVEQILHWRINCETQYIRCRYQQLFFSSQYEIRQPTCIKKLVILGQKFNSGVVSCMIPIFMIPTHYKQRQNGNNVHGMSFSKTQGLQNRNNFGFGSASKKNFGFRFGSIK